jgi:cytochrome P450
MLPDLSDPDTFNDGFPHAAFARLRREAPVWFHERDFGGTGPGFWVVSRYEDVKWVGTHPRIFSSAKGVTIRTDASQVEMGQSSMLFMDPPQHGRYRRLVAPVFTPRRLAELEERVRLRARAIVDAVAPRGECDFVTDLAAELPLQMISDLMGVPQEQRAVVFEASNRIIGSEDPDFGGTVQDAERGAMDLFVLAHSLAEERLANKRDDIISALLHGEVDGERMTPIQFDGFFALLAIAGNETTRNQTSHGMRLLLEHPEERRRLAADPSLLPSAIEEMLRYNPPVMYFRRTATQDVELAGQRIREGDKVTLYYPSANRDENVFPEPDRFDIGRSPNEHLAFGFGEHYCVGAHLARMQLRVLFEEVLTRMPDIELDGEISRLRSHFIDGIKRMPVRFTAS